MPQVKQKDFITAEVSGVTSHIANTAVRFRHGKEQVPYMWTILEGRIYVPRHGAGPNDIDVRSSQTSEAFRMLLFFN